MLKKYGRCSGGDEVLSAVDMNPQRRWAFRMFNHPPAIRVSEVNAMCALLGVAAEPGVLEPHVIPAWRHAGRAVASGNLRVSFTFVTLICVSHR